MKVVNIDKLNINSYAGLIPYGDRLLILDRSISAVGLEEDEPRGAALYIFDEVYEVFELYRIFVADEGRGYEELLIQRLGELALKFRCPLIEAGTIFPDQRHLGNILIANGFMPQDERYEVYTVDRKDLKAILEKDEKRIAAAVSRDIKSGRIKSLKELSGIELEKVEEGPAKGFISSSEKSFGKTIKNLSYAAFKKDGQAACVICISAKEEDLEISFQSLVGEADAIAASMLYACLFNLLKVMTKDQKLVIAAVTDASRKIMGHFIKVNPRITENVKSVERFMLPLGSFSIVNS